MDWLAKELKMKIEIAIPCYNESSTIEKVIRDFQAAMPEAEVVVYDNNSQDDSALRAKNAGARVILENRQGKGYVVETIFESSGADIVVLVDGDDTYEAKDAKKLIEPLISENVDMAIGTRLHTDKAAFRSLHRFGNRFLTGMLNTIFRTRYEDILSGYRAFSRSFIENVPIISRGFEVETELTIQALEKGMMVRDIPIRFRQRPKGSDSKLNTIGDGYRIVLMMIVLLRDHRPLFSFGLLGILLACISFPAWLIGFVHGSTNDLFSLLRSVSAFLIMLSIGLFLVGLILNTINTRMRENFLLMKRKRR